MFRKYNINKTFMPPKNSFLHDEFKKNNILIDEKTDNIPSSLNLGFISSLFII